MHISLMRIRIGEINSPGEGTGFYGREGEKRFRGGRDLDGKPDRNWDSDCVWEGGERPEVTSGVRRYRGFPVLVRDQNDNSGGVRGRRRGKKNVFPVANG